jgi:hypothetical protein
MTEGELISDRRPPQPDRPSLFASLALILLGLVLVICCQGLLEPALAAATPESVLEDLQYHVDAWILRDAARARILLTRLAPGRYRAELSGETRGLVKFLTGQRRDRFVTEMVFRQGRLMPVLYQEESSRRGKHYLKEYRFDYDQQRLELWQEQGGAGMVLKWHTQLKEPIYDPLSAFYNCRLQLLGPIKEGETLKLAGIPYPQPEEIVIRIGPMTPEGRKVMVTIVNRAFENERGLVFVYFDKGWAPTQAWTRVLHFGKIIGQLQPGSQPLKERRLEAAQGAGLRPSACQSRGAGSGPPL